VRRPAATALLLIVSLSTGCGASSKATKAPPPAAPATTAERTTSAESKPATTAATKTTTTTAPATTATTTPPTATTSTTQLVQQSLCPSEQRAGIIANFGHRPSTEAAGRLLARAEAVGFQGLVIQRRHCHDYAVVLAGLSTVRQARDLRREARSAGFSVTIECRSHPVEGGLAAVFGHRRSKRSALRLRREAERVGFRDLLVQQDKCNDWEVDLYGIKTPAQRQELAREAASVGFHLIFEPG
jgi:cell division septation protein DedD